MAVAVAPALPAYCIRGRAFDSVFVLGTAALALAAGLAGGLSSDLYRAILLLNLWFLGYHHVVASFTRIAFDRESVREHRFLLFVLPWPCLAAVWLIAATLGTAALTAVYFYWQAFHYTRQSYGVALRYARRQEGAPGLDLRSAKALLYLLPLWGVVQRSHEGHEVFLGLPLWLLPVPGTAALLVGVLALGAALWWLAEQLPRARAGTSSPWFLAYMLSHVAVFGFGYLGIADLDRGWLVVNVWHNAQYILFVWLANHQRFGGRVDERHRFLSWLSQREKLGVYLAVCLAISTLFYAGLRQVSDALVLSVIPLVFWGSMAANFHHYLVDGMIWKSRRPAPAPASR